MARIIYLIRHGETPGNRARVVQVPETPLSDRGLTQARRLGERLADAGLTRLLSSDLARARMTADAIAGTTGLSLELDSLYQERNFGDIRGTAYADLSQSPFELGYEPPAGESWPVFHERVDRAWERAREAANESSGPIALVTHGLVCHSLVNRHIDGLTEGEGPAPDFPPRRFGNTSVSILVPGAGPNDRWRVELLDCTRHLDTLSADDTEAPSGL